MPQTSSFSSEKAMRFFEPGLAHSHDPPLAPFTFTMPPSMNSKLREPHNHTPPRRRAFAPAAPLGLAAVLELTVFPSSSDALSTMTRACVAGSDRACCSSHAATFVFLD